METSVPSQTSGGVLAFGMRLAHRTRIMRLRPCLLALIGFVACSKPNADAHLKRGDALLAQGHTREAIVEYRVAVQLAPKRAEIHTRLSKAYEVIGEQDMVGEAVRAADLVPNDVGAQLRAGRLLLAAHAFVDAKARAEKAIALNPRDPEGLILLGNIAAGLKDFD